MTMVMMMMMMMICSKGFDERRGFIFFPKKLNHCFWRGKHDLIYYRKGIPVNTILFITVSAFQC